MIEQQTVKSLKEIQREKDARMDRYDSHMNQHGHYSVKAKKANLPRSPILDELLEQGVTLASNYAETHPLPEKVAIEVPEVAMESSHPVEVATPEVAIDESPNEKVAMLESQLHSMERKDPEYNKVYKALGRAKAKLGERLPKTSSYLEEDGTYSTYVTPKS